MNLQQELQSNMSFFDRIAASIAPAKRQIEEVLVHGSDRKGIDLSKKLVWQPPSQGPAGERQLLMEIQKLRSSFQYKIYGVGQQLFFEKIRTIIHKNGSGKVIHHEEKVV